MHKKNTLIFETCLSGHRLEYLNHIYMGAYNRKDETFVFVVPEHFKDIKSYFEWPAIANIQIRYMPDDEVEKVESEKNLMKSSYKHTRLLMKYVKDDTFDRILLISLMDYMPWVALSRLKVGSIYGIIYKIYLYDSFQGFRKLANKVIYNLFAHRKTIGGIFVLNDKDSAKKLNEIYHTSNFYFLPDPVPSINRNHVKCIREELGIKISDRMILHFGGLSERKGTLIIMEAIALMRQDQLKDKVFVFAGLVYDDLKERFYDFKKKLAERARIIVYDEFCSYSLINNLCESCDEILIPYLSTGQSSGVIGYASFFNKPIIGPGKGLIGELIREYNMGATLDDVTAENLKEAICGELPDNSYDYYKSHTVSNFISILLL